MNPRIVRRSETARRFPPIGPELYAVPPSGGEPTDAGRRLLAFAELPASGWQRIVGLGLSGPAKLGRLLLLHRLAFAAERAGQTRRADFFWREAHAALRRAWPDDALWEAARSVLGEGAPETVEALRGCIANELFFDSHAGFANARLAQGDDLPVDDRAFVHLQYLCEIVELQGSPPDLAGPLAPLLDARINSLRKANRWDEAIAQVQARYDASADREMLASLALLHFEAAINRLGKDQDARDAAMLGTTIERLENLRQAQPDATVLYGFLGRLHHLHAVRLANSDQLSAALVAARHAQAFAPGDSGVDETMSTLADNMRKLQAQLQEAEARVRQSPNLRLSEQGNKLIREARQGFTPLQHYIDSGEPEKIAAGRRLAHARTLWRDLDLPSEPEPSAEQVAALLDVANAVYGSDLTSHDELAAAFRAHAATRAALAGIDADRVAAFVLRRRRENAGDAVARDEAEPAATEPAVAVDAPLVMAGAPAAGRDMEPFGYWLFGTQDTGTRVFGVMAALALLVTIGVTAADAWGTSRRAGSYAAIVEAVAHDDDETVVAEAPRFLNAWTLRATDSRYMNVRELWRDALEAPHRRERDAASRELQLALERGDHGAAIEAAERFFDAPPVVVADPRQQVVADIYAREFSLWFVDLVDLADDTSQARIATYKRLTAGAAGSQP